MNIAQLLTPEIMDLIEHNDWINLKNVISDWLPPDIADLLGYLDSKDSVILFRLLPKSSASDVFAKLGIKEQEELLNKIGNSELATLIMRTSAKAGVKAPHLPVGKKLNPSALRRTQIKISLF